MKAALANPVDMIRAGAPHLIHTDEELKAYTNELFKLASAVEDEAIELLTLLIERY
jgi:HTH-type transcriptional regulator / antitoxin HigA